jgi:hypothetical protein
MSYPIGFLDWFEAWHKRDPDWFAAQPGNLLLYWVREQLTAYYRSPPRGEMIDDIAAWGAEAERISRRINYCLADTRFRETYRCGCFKCDPTNEEGVLEEEAILERVRSWRQQSSNERST